MRYRLLYPVFFIILQLAGCNETEVAPTKTTDLIPGEHLLLGNPSNATADPSNANNYLMEKPQYVLSYSRDRGTPNWVSWHVSQDWLGNAPRQDDFQLDNSLPDGWYRVSSTDYTGTGFDRGHNVPSADRTRIVEDNSATFLMTNIITQGPDHNREIWANLEDYTRSLVDDGNEVYVVIGSYGAGGTGSNGTIMTIDNGRITVPGQIWKVLVILPEGDNDLNRINSNTRVIAVNTPNINTVSTAWGTYRTSVDAIETATGYNLLSSLPSQLQIVLEAKTDTGPTQ